MEKYITKLKEIKSDKATNAIKLLESITAETPEPQKREFIEDAIELIEAELTSNDIRELLRNALKDKFQQEFGPFILDFSDSFVVFELESDQAWKADYSISNNKVVFGDSIKVIAKTTFEPIMESKKDKNGQFDLFEKNKPEEITGDYIQLIESAIKDDGTIPIKVIGPGWGSSGYYSEEVLQRDAGIYTEGTKMYWNHPTASEDIERPERSLNDLAGILVSEGAYDPEGASGPGVYASAKVFGQFQEQLTDMAPHIGLSHIAMGKATTGEAEGQTGTIIESLNTAQSIDFVTSPGAGGEIIQLFESARNNKSLKPINQMAEPNKELNQLKESNRILSEENNRLKEGQVLESARNYVESKLKESDLPDITKARLLDSLSKNPEVTEAGELDQLKFGESVKKGIEDEISYLAKLTESGKITGMGSSGDAEEADNTKLEESNKNYFGELGMSEKGVEIAIKGR